MRRLRPAGIFGARTTSSLRKTRRPISRDETLASSYAEHSAYAGFSANIHHDNRHGYKSLDVGRAIALRRSMFVREPDAESQGGAMTSESGQRPAYGDQMAKYFRLTHAPSLVIRPSSKPRIAITHLVSETGLPERTAPIPAERAFVVSIHLTPAAERG